MQKRFFEGSLWLLMILIIVFIMTSIASSEETVYKTVWPRGKKVVKIVPVAKRLDTLAGKTVCELWDYLFRGNEIFPMLEKMLSERYPGIKFVKYDKFGSTHGGEEAKVIAALPSKLKEFGCDAVISGVGC